MEFDVFDGKWYAHVHGNPDGVWFADSCKTAKTSCIPAVLTYGSIHDSVAHRH